MKCIIQAVKSAKHIVDYIDKSLKSNYNISRKHRHRLLCIRLGFNMFEKILEDFHNGIKQEYEELKKPLGANIIRGHIPSASAIAENQLAIMISKAVPECRLILDTSIYVNKKNHRPDLMIIDGGNNVVAMIEVKSNMGYCRWADNVIDSMTENDTAFKNEKTLICQFSGDQQNMEIFYGSDVKLFLVAVSGENCNEKYHIHNKEYAKQNNVEYYILFDGWYNDLKRKEINDFLSEISKI